MKLYLNLLSIFIGIFAITSLAIAEIPDPEVAETEVTETISKKSTSQTEQSLTEDEITDREPNINDSNLSESDNSTTTKATEKAIEKIEIVQCSFAEVVIDPEPELQIAAKKLDLDSDFNLEISYEELVTDSTITDSEINEETATYIAANSEELLTGDSEDQGKKKASEEVAVESSSPIAATNKDVAEVAYTIECLSPQEYTHYQKLLIADNLYKAGNKLSAAKIYQEEKEAWETELDPSQILPEANSDPAKLSPGGAVYWRIYQEGKQQGLESKILTPLELLVAKEPEFIPGHIHYAESLLTYEREEESLAVLENAISLYPKNVELLREKIDADLRTKRWIDASISSRQFALFNPEHPEATEFTRLADEYLAEFKSDVKEQLTLNAIGNAITGAVGFALTGNIFGPISAVDTTLLLLRGESNLGERFAKKAQKQLPMVENEALLDYVREVGDKVAASSGRDEFNYEFYVVMDNNINAFALPGGKIFVNLGVILNTDSEAELAGLLAHEIAHAVLSHGFQLATRGSLTANLTQYIPYVGGTAGNLIVMNYSRDMERQADIYGTKILVASDYAADGVRDLMANLQHVHEQDEDHVEPPAWLSTHPNTSERVRYMEELIVSNNLNRYAYEGVEQHYKMKLLAKRLWRQYKKEQASKVKKEYLDY